MSFRFRRLVLSTLPGSGTGPQMLAGSLAVSCGQTLPCDQGRCGPQGQQRAPVA